MSCDLDFGYRWKWNRSLIISILIMLGAIFYNPIYKSNIKFFGENNPRNWHFKNQKTDKIFTIILRIMMFSIGFAGFIYTLFFSK